MNKNTSTFMSVVLSSITSQGTTSLPSGLNTNSNGIQLMTDAAATHQTGIYQCIARNSAGIDQKDISITVYGAFSNFQNMNVSISQQCRSNHQGDF